MKRLSFFLLFFCPLFGQAQWLDRISPGGSASELAVIDGHFFTLSGSKVYRSSNYGQIWEYAGPDDPALSFNQIVTEGDTLYAAGTRIFRTTDLGKTWQEVLPAPYFWVNGYRLLGVHKGRLYWQEANTLSELTPGAAQWETLATFGNTALKLAFYNEYIFIATWQGIYRYDRLTHTLDGLNNTPSYEIFFWNGNLLSGALLSTDLGQTWGPAGNIPDCSFLTEADGTLYGVSGTGIWRSDNFTDWSQVYPPVSPYAVKVAAAGKVVLATSDFGGILRSTDLGAHWTVNNSGLPSGIGAPWTVKNDLPSFLQLDRFLSADGGKNWFSAVANYGVADILVQDQNTMLTVSYQNGSYVILSSDLAMQDWQWLSNVPTPFGGGFFAKTGDKLLYNSNKILVSADGGKTWAEEGSMYQSGGLGYPYRGHLFSAGVNGGLAMSPDFGHTWQDISPAGSGNYYKVFASGDNLFAWHDYYMFVSQNFGATWTDLSPQIPSPAIGNWAFTASGDSLFMAKKDSVFFSPNRGQSWVNITDDLGMATCEGLQVFQGELIALNVNGQVRALPLSALTSIPVDGIVFHDPNKDGIRDAGEQGFPNFMVHNTARTAYAFTDTAGMFRLLSDPAGDSALVVLPWTYATSTPAAQPVVPGSDLPFGIYYEPGVKDLCISATAATPFVPGFEARVVLTVKNLGPTVQDASVELLLDDGLAFTGSAPGPVSVDGNKIEWSILGLEPFQTATITLTCQTSVSLAAGDPLVFSASVGPPDGDAAPSNNTVRLRETVRSSFDPNDKYAHTGDRYSTVQYAANEPIAYTVRFQNTGNYPAQFVRIVDTVDAQFDLASFTLLAHSHPVQVSLEGNNRLVFFFDRINLPDSSANEPASHGFVTYGLKPRPGLAVGSEFRNTAYIFFDYNLPVQTNTVLTTLALPVAAPEAPQPPLLLRPNPTTGSFVLTLPADAGPADAVQIFDLYGRLLWTGQPPSGAQEITGSLAGLPPGVYVVEYRQNGQVLGRAKIVKQ